MCRCDIFSSLSADKYSAVALYCLWFDFAEMDIPFAWQAWQWATSIVFLRGRRGTCGTRLGLVTRLVAVGRPDRRSTLHGKRGAWRHGRSIWVAGVAHGDIHLHFRVALTALGWPGCVSHAICHTQLCRTHNLSHTIFHTHLCHTPCFTHNNLSHTISHTIFVTHNFVTHNFVTHHLSHTVSSYTGHLLPIVV